MNQVTKLIVYYNYILKKKKKKATETSQPQI